MSFARPPTGGRRPGTRGRMAAVPGSSMGRNVLPGSRAGRPSSRAGQGGPAAGFASQLRVADRPITQHGVSGMKTGVRGPERTVYDKTYYMGILRGKNSELNSEIAKLQKEADAFNAENASYMSFQKKAESLALELKELQGVLSDYNTVVDQLNTNGDMAEIDAQRATLHAQNERETRNLDVLFVDRAQKDSQIEELEVAVEREKRTADDLVADMDDETKARYAEAKALNEELCSKLQSQQQELEGLESAIHQLEEELSQSSVKQAAADLYRRLQEVEAKRDEVIEEAERDTKETPEQERERLLKQVRDDNQEIAGMQKKTAELRDQIDELHEQLSQLDSRYDDQLDDKLAEYQKIRQQKEKLAQFLENFPEKFQTEVSREEQLEAEITSLLESSSRRLAAAKHLPSPEELLQLQDDLLFKEGELEKSDLTAQELEKEHEKLKQQLSRFSVAEEKLHQERAVLNGKMSKMQEELVLYDDIAGLQRDAEAKKKQLGAEKTALSLRRDTAKKRLEELTAEHDKLKTQLASNDTHTQLVNLERRWQHFEQSNFVMQEFIAARSTETNYRPVLEKVFTELHEHNANIIKALAGSSRTFG